MKMRAAALALAGVATCVVASVWAAPSVDASIRAQLASGLASGQRSGCAWRVVATKRLPADVQGLAAPASGDVWAVGPGLYGDVKRRPVIAHWNGKQLELTYPLGTQVAYGTGLEAITAVEPDAVWAVGRSFGDPLVVRWNGREWRVAQTAPLGASAGLYDVVGLSRNDVWAVGSVDGNSGYAVNPLALHWNSRTWRARRIGRQGSLYTVDAAGPGAMWAMGDDNGLGGGINEVDGLALRLVGRTWVGSRWVGVSTPIPDDSDLGHEAVDEFTSVDVVSQAEAWAVHGGSARSDIQRYDGKSWQISTGSPSRSRSTRSPR